MNNNALATLRHLYVADGPLTTTEVAKRVFGDDADLKNADRKARYYLEDSCAGLVETDDSGETRRYSIDQERVHLGAGRVELFTVDGDEVSVGLGEVMVLRDDGGEPSVVRIGDSDEG